jgi:hypothetical protein
MAIAIVEGSSIVGFGHTEDEAWIDALCVAYLANSEIDEARAVVCSQACMDWGDPSADQLTHDADGVLRLRWEVAP